MIYEKLYNWQQGIINKFFDKQSFGLFLDMGLGKTPISLGFAEAHKCEKVIVITINSKALEDEHTSGSWLNWSKQSNMNYVLTNKYSNNIGCADNSVFLINYESLFSRKVDRTKAISLSDKVMTFIKSCKDKTVSIIIDESHKMKDMQSKQTKAIFEIKRELSRCCKAMHVYLLSGTPFTQGYIDLYTQLKMLGYQETKGKFTDDFCIKGSIAGLYEWQQPIVGYKNIDALYALIHRYAITIMSKDMVDLPETVFVEHRMPISTAFEAFVSETMKGKDILLENDRHSTKMTKNLDRYNVEKKVNNPFFRNIAYPNLDWFADTNGVFWLRARQLSIGFQGNASKAEWFDRSRLNAIKTFLMNNEDNYVLFYNYTSELTELFDICEELDYKIDVYCGEIKSLTFYEEYEKLSESEQLVSKKRIILANFASGSTGMNWQLYNKCIITSLPVYKDYAQALKRIHRLGQKHTCIYHIFYSMNWLDYSMKKSLDECTTYTLDMFMADLDRIKSIQDESN